MPFKSKAQARYLFSREPEVAERWAKETPKMKSLPEKKGKQSAESTRRKK
jgi:hypothetical protein